MTSAAGASEDHSGDPPPSGAKAKPPTNTGPAAGGRSGSRPGSSAIVREASARMRRALSPKRPRPRSSTTAAAPSPASAKPRRSGCSRQKKRSPSRRRGQHRRGQVHARGQRHGDGGHRRVALAPGQRHGALGAPEEQPLGLRSEREGRLAVGHSGSRRQQDDEDDPAADGLRDVPASCPRAPRRGGNDAARAPFRNRGNRWSWKRDGGCDEARRGGGGARPGGVRAARPRRAAVEGLGDAEADGALPGVRGQVGVRALPRRSHARGAGASASR